MTDTFDAMILAPHPDDAEICCGGTILRLVAAGKRVAIVDLTRGEMSTKGDPASRQRECDAATDILGVQERVNLDLPDTGLDATNETQIAKVVGEIRRLRPRILFAPHERDVHPDHVAAAAIARRAWFLAGLAKFEPSTCSAHRPKTLVRFPGNDHVDPSFCVDISEFETKKRAAIECFATQVKTGTHFAKQADPLARSTARDRYFGAMVGCLAAEPFEIDGPLRLGALDCLMLD